MQIKLGDKCKDKITGFAGTCTARCEYLYDGPIYLIERNGDIESKWIQEQRLEVVSE